MSCCGFCDCDKERMSHTFLLDTRPLIDTVQVAFLKKGNDGILRQLAVGKGWSGLCSGIRGEWQPSSVRCWEFKIKVLLTRGFLTDSASALHFANHVKQHLLKARRLLLRHKRKLIQEASCRSILQTTF